MRLSVLLWPEECSVHEAGHYLSTPDLSECLLLLVIVCYQKSKFPEFHENSFVVCVCVMHVYVSVSVGVTVCVYV